MSVRLEQLLAAATTEPTGESTLDEQLAWTRARQEIEKLAPDMVRLLIDMGEELRGANGTRYGTVDIPQWRVDALLARLDGLAAGEEDSCAHGLPFDEFCRECLPSSGLKRVTRIPSAVLADLAVIEGRS